MTAAIPLSDALTDANLLGAALGPPESWATWISVLKASFGEKLDVTSYANGDRKMLSAQDAGTCAPAGVSGKTYTVTVWYKSPAQAPIIFAFYRLNGAWQYWAQSARFAAASAWTQASWTTPALPSGATHISVGMGLNIAGSVTMDDFVLVANG